MAKKVLRAPKKSFKLNFGFVAFIGIFVISYLMLITSVDTILMLGLLGLLGAMVGIFNIRVDEEKDFLISITALNVIIIAWVATIQLPLMISMFLINLVVAFGAAGIIIALAIIIRTGLTK